MNELETLIMQICEQETLLPVIVDTVQENHNYSDKEIRETVWMLLDYGKLVQLEKK